METAIKKVIGYYMGALVPIGTITNVITTVICFRKRLRVTPTYIFLAFIAALDIIPFYFIDLKVALLCINNIPMDSPFYCVLYPGLPNICFEASSWIMVLMVLERCLSVKVTIWRKRLFNSKKAIIVATVTTLILFMTNFVQFLSTPYGVVRIQNSNQTKMGCKSSQIYYAYATLHTYMYSIIPFVLIFLINCVLAHSTYVSKSGTITRSKSEDAKRKAISITVLCMSIAFILFTAPNSIFIGYFVTQGGIILFATSAIMFTYHSSNLLILLITNKQFLKEARGLIKHWNRVDVTTSKMTGTGTELNTNKTQTVTVDKKSYTND